MIPTGMLPRRLSACANSLSMGHPCSGVSRRRPAIATALVSSLLHLSGLSTLCTHLSRVGERGAFRGRPKAMGEGKTPPLPARRSQWNGEGTCPLLPHPFNPPPRRPEPGAGGQTSSYRRPIRPSAICSYRWGCLRDLPAKITGTGSEVEWQGSMVRLLVAGREIAWIA
jgi:hypothetical protein